VVGGSVVSLLSAVEVWMGERNPPWQLKEGAGHSEGRRRGASRA
jgi:hypothetical protein